MTAAVAAAANAQNSVLLARIKAGWANVARAIAAGIEKPVNVHGDVTYALSYALRV